MQRIFHTPEGVRDIYNGECSRSIIFRQKSAKYLIPMDMRRLKLLPLNILKYSAEK